MTPLKKIRISRKLTLMEVARAIGTDTGNLSRIESGKQRSPDMAEKLSRYYGGAITELQILYPARFMEPADREAS